MAATASSAINAVASATSVLGKRSRDALDSAKDKFQSLSRAASLRSHRAAKDLTESPAKKRLRASTGRAVATDVEEKELTPEPPKRPRKLWLSQGLYVGQTRESQPVQKSNKRKSTSAVTVPERTYLPMPMFHGERLLKQGRDFKLPFEIFNALPKVQGPVWSSLKRSKSINFHFFIPH
jgi:histone-lysine N-methyltransferase ASH1L